VRFPAGCCRAARPCPRVARRDHRRGDRSYTDDRCSPSSSTRRPTPLASRATLVQALHRQECLNPTGIRDHPRTVGPKHADPLLSKAPANRLLLALDLAGASLHRTQEVAGSSPASSTPGTPADAGVLPFRPRIGASKFWLTRSPRSKTTFHPAPPLSSPSPRRKVSSWSGRGTIPTRPGLRTTTSRDGLHDHLFVPYDRAAEAVAVLEDLAPALRVRPGCNTSSKTTPGPSRPARPA
jgi:hypothetical protein